MSVTAGFQGLPAESSQNRVTVYWLAGIIVAATMCRLVIGAFLAPGTDEAYAIGVARQFSLSYFDHPPLHFWLVGAWAKLWGSEDLLLLRLPFVALSAVSTWLLFDLTRRLFGDQAGIWAAAIFNLAPVFGLVHGTLILPDGPLLCAGLGMAHVVARILFEPEQGAQRRRWLAAGLLAGLAALSKYHGLLMIGGMLLFLSTSSAHRHWLRRPEPWLAALVAAAMFTPVVIWNAEHDWVSFGFQSGRSNWGAMPRLDYVARSVQDQAIYLLPWLALPLLVVLVRALVTGPRNDRSWLLACLALPPLVLFTWAASLRTGYAHWHMPGWLFAIPLLGEAAAQLRPIHRRIAAGAALLTAVGLTGFVSVVLPQSRWGTFEQEIQAAFSADPTDTLMSWDGLREELAARQLPADGRTFIAAFSWIRAAQLTALFGKEIPVLCICGDARHFQYLNPPATFAGWTGILIDKPSALEDDKTLSSYFDAVTAPEDASLEKAGRVVVRLSLRVGTGFRPARQDAAPPRPRPGSHGA